MARCRRSWGEGPLPQLDAPDDPGLPGTSFRGGEEFIRLAYSWEPPERNDEVAMLIAHAIKNAR